MVLEPGTEAVPSSSVLPARCNERNFAAESSKKQYRDASSRNPRYNFVIGGDFNHLEASEVKENTQCTWMKTSGSRSKKYLIKVFVSNTDLFDQAETFRTSFNTDHLAIILQPKKPLKAERRKINVGTIAFRSDRGLTSR